MLIPSFLPSWSTQSPWSGRDALGSTVAPALVTTGRITVDNQPLPKAGILAAVETGRGGLGAFRHPLSCRRHPCHHSLQRSVAGGAGESHLLRINVLPVSAWSGQWIRLATWSASVGGPRQARPAGLKRRSCPGPPLCLSGFVHFCWPLATSWSLTAGFWTPDFIMVTFLFAAPGFERSWSSVRSGHGCVTVDGWRTGTCPLRTPCLPGFFGGAWWGDLPRSVTGLTFPVAGARSGASLWRSRRGSGGNGGSCWRWGFPA